jgi:hypothetical protein
LFHLVRYNLKNIEQINRFLKRKLVFLLKMPQTLFLTIFYKVITKIVNNIPKRPRCSSWTNDNNLTWISCCDYEFGAFFFITIRIGTDFFHTCKLPNITFTTLSNIILVFLVWGIKTNTRCSNNVTWLKFHLLKVASIKKFIEQISGHWISWFLSTLSKPEDKKANPII